MELDESMRLTNDSDSTMYNTSINIDNAYEYLHIIIQIHKIRNETASMRIQLIIYEI